MKRTEKISLLTKVIQGNAPASLLHQATQMPRQGLIIISDIMYEHGQPETDNDSVHFTHRGQLHQMTLGEAQQYANQYRMGTIFILPAKGEMQ
jgi:hypothetical protein